MRRNRGVASASIIRPSRLAGALRGAGALVFESEALENVPTGWKARETYQAESADEFTETFELASGTGAYELYSKTRFKRVRRP